MKTLLQYVVAVGNPFDGISLFGPYATRDQAFLIFEDCENDWWIVDLHGGPGVRDTDDDDGEEK